MKNMLIHIPRTMTSLVVDPTALTAVHWYLPASSTVTCLMIRYGFSMFSSDNLPPLPWVSILFPFLVQNTLWISGEPSNKDTFPINFNILFFVFVSWLIIMFGRPRLINNHHDYWVCLTSCSDIRTRIINDKFWEIIVNLIVTFAKYILSNATNSIWFKIKSNFFHYFIINDIQNFKLINLYYTSWFSSVAFLINGKF